MFIGNTAGNNFLNKWGFYSLILSLIVLCNEIFLIFIQKTSPELTNRLLSLPVLLTMAPCLLISMMLMVLLTISPFMIYSSHTTTIY